MKTGLVVALAGILTLLFLLFLSSSIGCAAWLFAGKWGS
jgi:hypothetical protein